MHRLLPIPVAASTAVFAASALLGCVPSATAGIPASIVTTCPPGQQVRIVINYRGVLTLYWDDGMQHREKPQFSSQFTTITYDTMAQRVGWRAEVRADNNGIPGRIADSRGICVEA